MYVLVMNNINSEDFAVYFSHFGLLRFCSEPYFDPTRETYDQFNQLTNRGISAKNLKLTVSPMMKWLDVLPTICEKIHSISDR
jgi:hypothetical protein